MTELKLRSSGVNICDYHTFDISRFAVDLQADPVQYERDLLNFRKRFAARTEADTVQREDMVTLSCQSRNPRFQKEHMMLRAGLGLFSGELEEKITGMHVGEERMLTVGEDAVTVSVEQIIREQLPELSDELAEQSGMPEIRTADDVRAWCRGKQFEEELEEPADEGFSWLAGQVIQNSHFRLDNEELALSRDMVLSSFLKSFHLHDKPFEETTDEELTEAFGMSKQELLRQMEQTGDYTLKAAVLGQSMRTLDADDYEAYLEKRAIAEEMTKDEAEGKYLLQIYLIQTYSDFYLDTIEQYVIQKLKEAIR